MQKLKLQLGFTMIELLIVITILGILAVAVLSAINPIEQINRGRDTSRQSDAEQLLSAIDRYNAFQGFYPWQEDADQTNTSVMVDVDTGEITTAVDTGIPVVVTALTPCAILDESPEACTEGADCPIVDRLSTGDASDSCRGAQELKDSFITRVTDPASRSLYVYNSGANGGSTYVCFVPQSGAFETQASDRCANAEDTYGVGLPTDIGLAAREYICNVALDRDGDEVEDGVPMVCLP